LTLSLTHDRGDDAADAAAFNRDARLRVARPLRVSPIPVWVRGDRIHLAEIVSNLLTNAIAFTAPGDSITVEVGEREGSARLVVADTGSGISSALLPHVFDKYSREAGTQRAGRGLGLYVVRRLVERHQGSVRVESAGLGLGARFVVTLASAAADVA
jgi:signal transduction histidine kinase